MGQVASLTTSSGLTLLAIRSGVNALLPREIRVATVEEAPPGFDARRWARAKRYGYFIENAAVASPLLQGFTWHVPQPLDRTAMAVAMRRLRGKHDFASFCAAPGKVRNPVCQIFSARVKSRRQFLALLFSADSFLHHMVRNIVGSLVEVGKGHRPPGWIGDLLRARDRTLAGPTAPAHGLVLLRVLYPREHGRQPRACGNGHAT